MKRMIIAGAVALGLCGDLLAESDYNPYSIINQAKQMEADREKRAVKHKRYNLEKQKRVDALDAERAGRNDGVSRLKQRRIDRADCDLYKSYARKYEYKDEEKHLFWNRQAVKKCR